MKIVERPILFTGPNVRAILEGRKTQKRRVVKPPRGWETQYAHADVLAIQPAVWWWNGVHDRVGVKQECPYGQPGDQLWVRETHAIVPRTAYRCSDGVEQALRPDDDHDAAIYREGWTRSTGGIRWRPSIHMPRWASRITLEVIAVRVERLQAISEDSAKAEGVAAGDLVTRKGTIGPFPAELRKSADTAREAFAALWESINGPGSWDANPWVWVIEFKRVEA